MKHFQGCVVFLFLACSVFGQTEDKTGITLDWYRASMFRYRMVGVESCRGVGKIVSGEEDEDSGKEKKRKKPIVGVLLSTVLPGTGEMYGGSWRKGLVFLGVEVALWIGYWQFGDSGREWEAFFRAYADEHWDEDEWQEWMEEHPEFADTTHTLPSEKNQQYYEMIGKYDQFKAGWDDYEDPGPALTAHRAYYEGLRHKSNIQFKRASYCAMVSLGNRVLSAIDAAWTIRRHNRQIEGELRMSLKRGRVDYVPCLTLSLNW